MILPAEIQRKASSAGVRDQQIENIETTYVQWKN
jgi:hypothetical protein